jgi:hypothetical protein
MAGSVALNTCSQVELALDACLLWPRRSGLELNRAIGRERTGASQRGRGMSDRKGPSKGPSTPPSNRSPNNPRAANNLSPGVKEGQGRGPDGKLLPKQSPAAYGEPAGDPSVPPLYRAMKLVLGLPEAADRTQYKRSARRMLEQKPVEFGNKLADYEKALAAASAHRRTPHSESGDSVQRDEGSERVEALLEDLIAKHQDELAKEDAELAARSNAAELGKARQQSLKEALERERLLRVQVAELRRARKNVPDENHRLMEEGFAECHGALRAQDIELAIRPDPANILASLEHALSATRERVEIFQRELDHLHCGAAVQGENRSRR